MCIDNDLKQLEGVVLFIEKCKNEGFNSSLSIAKIIAHDIDVMFQISIVSLEKKV